MQFDKLVSSTLDATLAGIDEPDAIDRERRRYEPLVALVAAYENGTQTVLANPGLNERGRQDALATLAEKTHASAKPVFAAIERWQSELNSEDGNLRAAAGQGGTTRRHRESGGWIRTLPPEPDQPTDLHAQRVFIDLYGRDENRLAEFRSRYRNEWVPNGDPRAGIAEREFALTGILLTPADIDAARRWRIEHSEFAPRLRVLEAHQRAVRLIVGEAKRRIGLVEAGELVRL